MQIKFARALPISSSHSPFYFCPFDPLRSVNSPTDDDDDDVRVRVIRSNRRQTKTRLKSERSAKSQGEKLSIKEAGSLKFKLITTLKYVYWYKSGLNGLNLY